MLNQRLDQQPDFILTQSVLDSPEWNVKSSKLHSYCAKDDPLPLATVTENRKRGKEKGHIFIQLLKERTSDTTIQAISYTETFLFPPSPTKMDDKTAKFHIFTHRTKKQQNKIRAHL